MKVDAFSLLGLPHAAFLTGDEIREAFQRAGAATHPDAAEDEDDRARRTRDFAALNDARAILASVPRRLRHLLELEYPETAATKTGAVMDGEMMDLFSTTGEAVRAATAIQAKKQKASTALARAMLAGEEMRTQENLEAATEKVESAWASLEAELKTMDAMREGGTSLAPALQSCAARAGFLEKWQAQLRAAFAGFFGN